MLSVDWPHGDRLRAYAKINLSLAVLARRADGFHEIRTVFQTISLADTLLVSFEPSRRTRIDVTSSVSIPGENICARAADRVLAAAGQNGHVRIHIQKRIPMGGGLGGGSADGAAVLRWLALRLGRQLDLAALAADLGSDVPFFLEGGCAVGAGRGEELYPLPHPGAVEGILLTPPVQVSTAAAYGGLGRPGLVDVPDARHWPAAERVRALAWALDRRAPLPDWAGACVNDFEASVFSRYPQLARLRENLVAAGALVARMTGSGAALFGLYRNREAANRAAEGLRAVLREGGVRRFRFLSRAAYQRSWRRSVL